MQDPHAQRQYPTLTSLLSGTPTQHDLSEGVFANRVAVVMSMQPDVRHQARFNSCKGLHAGSWLTVFPTNVYATARARHYQLALASRLGCAIPELLPVNERAWLCGGCHMPIAVK